MSSDDRKDTDPKAFYDVKGRPSKDLPADTAQPELPTCFVIMPIADQAGYQPGHFQEVYEDLIGPAIRKAGFAPVRADDVHAANLIHLDILGKLLDAPMAVCDLSSVNPNVMFELGIRQAFDKPVVLMRDKATRDVFDIGPIRYVSYDGTLPYRGVNAAREALAAAITATAAMKPGEGTNSIVSLLGLRAAAIKPSDQDPQTARFTLLEKSVADIASDIKSIASEVRYSAPTKSQKGSTSAITIEGNIVKIRLESGLGVSLSKGAYRNYVKQAATIINSRNEDAKTIFRTMDSREMEILDKIIEKEFNIDIFDRLDLH